MHMKNELFFLFSLLLGINEAFASDTFQPEHIAITDVRIAGLCRQFSNVSGIKMRGEDIDVCQYRQSSGLSSRASAIDWRGGPPLTPGQLKLKQQRRK